MRRIPAWTAFALVMLVLPCGVGAQGKIRIAIWDFENHSEQSWWFSGDLGPALRNHIDTAFSQNPTLNARFSIVEREALENVLKEQGLASSGALDQQTAAKVGQILGVRYILTGAIDRFDINTTRGGFGRLGGSVTTAEAAVNIRFIDTTSAERVVSVSAEGKGRKGGGSFGGASLSREAEWGIASEAIEKAASEVVSEFVRGNYFDKFSAGGVAGGTEGKIIKVDGNQAWINMGSFSGIQVGDKFDIFNVGEELVDPDTGQVLGVAETRTGSGEVTDVRERFSVMTFSGTAAAGDVVRKP